MTRRTSRRAQQRIACLIGLAAFHTGCSLSRSYPEGILVDQVAYDKTVFAQSPNFNLVWDLRQGNFDDDNGEEILALANDGVHLLQLDGKEKRFTPFQSPEPPFGLSIVKDSKTGRLRFLGNLPNARKTVLFDDSGNILWSAVGGSYDTPKAGDLDGDGRLEIIAKPGNVLSALNLEGAVVRQLPNAGSPLFFDVADMNGDGRAEIVAEDSQNEMSILSGDGIVLTRWKSPHPFYRFSLAQPAEAPLPVVLILSDDAEELLLLDWTGKTVGTLKAPWGNKLATPEGGVFQVGNTQGFVTLATSKGSNHHHNIYVYGPDRQLVYLDSAGDDSASLLVVQNANPPAFLVGGRNAIWKYTEKR